MIVPRFVQIQIQAHQYAEDRAGLFTASLTASLKAKGLPSSDPIRFEIDSFFRWPFVSIVL